MEVMTVCGYVIDSDKSHPYAKELYLQGNKPTFSSGLECEFTCGYGELDEWGYWEFPLYVIE